MKRIVVIGAGITGLAAAHRLLELRKVTGQQLEIILLEASSRAGGVLLTEALDGFLLERGPDSFISEKPEAIQLSRRLNIDSHLIETNPVNRRSFIVRNGRLRRVPEGFHLLAPSQLVPFLTSDIFSFAGKARMAAELLLPRKTLNGNSDESLAQFVRRRLGEEALTRVAQPMVGGIYTADPEKLSLRATFPRFLEMEAKHRSIILALLKTARRTPTTGTSGARYSLFLSFNRGMQLLSDTLIKRITSEESAVRLRLNTTVQSVARDKETSSDKWRVTVGPGETLIADGVCLALPAHLAAEVLQDVSPTIATELHAIPYASTATINLGYTRNAIPHPLDGFGFVVPYIEKRSVLACTFSSVKFAGRAPEGHVLLRAFAGGALQPDVFALDEDEMVARVREDLRALLGISTPPLFTKVSKWSRSMPQYELGHLSRVERINKELQNLPGLKVAGNAYNGAGIPDCIRSGETAAEELMKELQKDVEPNSC
jgi:protoporphyrinogen/coproporphyrinogen III oxidase